MMVTVCVFLHSPHMGLMSNVLLALEVFHLSKQVMPEPKYKQLRLFVANKISHSQVVADDRNESGHAVVVNPDAVDIYKCLRGHFAEYGIRNCYLKYTHSRAYNRVRRQTKQKESVN